MPVKKIPWDETKTIICPGDYETTLNYCVDHFINAATKAIELNGHFYAALSGGSTPKAIFKKLATMPDAINWQAVSLFWGDERAVPPDSDDSNYRMAQDASLFTLPIPPDQIHRMQAEENIDKNALAYERLIKQTIPDYSFDLMMLGMGDDGHTASLFPGTKALREQKHLVVANFVPQKNTYRMTATYPLINNSKQIVVYVLGKTKSQMLHTLLTHKDTPPYPVELIGTKEHPALFIVDDAATKKLF